jgi:hypothetical protein
LMQGKTPLIYILYYLTGVVFFFHAENAERVQ